MSGDAGRGLSLDQAVRVLALAPRLLLMLDYDGTLTPIVDHPDLAGLDPETVDVLDDLVALPDTVIAVVSGRRRQDLEGFLEIPGLLLVGGHGAETETGADLDDAGGDILRRVIGELEAIAEIEPAAFVEVKPTSAALHVRQVAAGGERLVELALEGPGRIPGVRALTGKAVVEISVSDMDKGSAVSDLRANHPGGIACFIGDDVTDEDAFAALEPPDLGVKVGVGDTVADLRLCGQGEVRPFLEEIVSLRRDRRRI